MSNLLEASKNLRVDEFFKSIADDIPQYINDLDGLIGTLTPLLKESYMLGAETAQLEFYIYQDELIPIPKDLKFNLEALIGTFIIEMQTAVKVYKTKVEGRKKILAVNGADITSDIQLKQFRNEMINKLKMAVRGLFIDSNNQGHLAMQEYIGDA